MSSEVFYEGAAEFATLTNTFSVNGTPTDPTTISLTVTDPAGTSTTYTHPATITRVSAGVYTKDIACILPGTWVFVWIGTGTASDVQAGTWTVFDIDLAKRYCSLEELKSRIGEAATEPRHDFVLSLAIDAASRSIDKFCGRVFYGDSTATARLFYPEYLYKARVDDFHTITDLAIATGSDGSYTTVWSASDYQLEPLNGLVDGEPGWPFYWIRAVSGRTFPCSYANQRAPLQVTAKWGWADVPANVKEAALIMSEEAFKLADAPFGVGGYGNFGIVRVRDNPFAARLLGPYQRFPILVH